MAQRFTSLEDAAKQLGISKDRLTHLREADKVRGYRDGTSWKFRAEDIERLEADGIPQIEAPPSDFSLDLDEDTSTPPPSAASGVDLEIAEEESIPDAGASDVSLEDVDEPTVAGIDEGGSSDSLIDLDEGGVSISDSILLSEAELGESTGRPPSTIIGKAELDLDADLDLSPIDQGPMSDVKLAPASDILPGADVDIGLDLPSPSGDFAGLEELDVDLEAESSRILSPEDVAKVKGAVAAKQEAEISDLELAPTESTLGRATSDIGLGGDAGSGTGLTGLSALELEEDDDDQVLGEGSDVTLSSESSGINIISPSDSGLALDEVSLDLSGASAIGSSLDLGSSVADDVSLEPLMVGEGFEEPKAGEDFQLTPLGEEGAEEEERDSSQVIALDELSEEAAGPGLDVGVSESGMLREEFGMGLAHGVAPVGVVAAAETPFSIWNVLGLASCLLLLGLCGMMVFDLLRNIWSWNDVTTLNSSLLEVLNPFL
ncbi:MAG: helix-turn-helix domain-containing protein [Pirellulales bacterium]